MQFLYVFGVGGFRQKLQIFVVGVHGLCILVLLFVGLAQKFPRRGQ